MSIALPRVVQRPTPNYSPTPIKHDLFRWHFMQGGFDGSIVWLCNPDAKASATLGMRADGSEVAQMAPLSMKAWDACAFNSRGIGLEIEGYTERGMPDVTLDAAALICAWYCLAYGVPPTWAEGGQGRGICTHHDLGIGGGGHVDICGVGDALWHKAVSATQNAFATLKALPSIPVFALHGLPGPADVSHVVSTVAPTPSHNGAWRKEAADTISHPTASRYPAHSIAALQADLNAIMDSGLDVDGWMGPKTGKSLEAFQATRGCTVDGIAGAQTWAALDAAMTKLSA